MVYSVKWVKKKLNKKCVSCHIFNKFEKKSLAMKYLFLLFILSSFGAFSQTINCFDVARKGTLQEMKDLYKENPKVLDSINDRKSSMLILACYYSNNEVASFLIKNKANINYVSDNGTALMACVVKANNAIAKVLIENKAAINSTDNKGATALIYAVMFHNVELVQLLLAQKADKTIKDKNGKTAFEYAVFSGNDEIINLLK